MKSITRRYPKDDFLIVWRPERCTHSGICFRGLPAVFDPRRRPWVVPEGAEAAAILAQVGRCPSGALSIERPGAGATAGAAGEAASAGDPGAEAAEVTRIEAQPDGPLRVHGALLIRASDGTCHLRSGTTALCRCGGSANKPFCDGTHARNGFRG